MGSVKKYIVNPEVQDSLKKQFQVKNMKDNKIRTFQKNLQNIFFSTTLKHQKNHHGNIK